MGTRAIRSMLSAFALLLAASNLAMAQGDANQSPENRFLLTGYGFATYTDKDSQQSFEAGFSPILLYRVTDRVLFEAEIEFDLEEEAVETEVEYAQVDWLVNDRLTVVAGRFLTPFGTFIEKQHPAWINKLPTMPLPYEHHTSLVPFGQTGLQLRGGVPLGDGYRRFTYSVFLSNGFEAAAHDEEGEGHGGHMEMEEERISLVGSPTNGNGDLALGCRLAVVPIQGLEIGASYLSGNYDEAGSLQATMSGLDIGYHAELFDLRAEWLDTTTERGPDDDGEFLPDQEIQSWYVQPSLRLSVIPVYAFNKLELVARFAKLDLDEADEEQLSVGLNYYLQASSILRVAWERREIRGHPATDGVNVMFAVGF